MEDPGGMSRSWGDSTFGLVEMVVLVSLTQQASQQKSHGLVEFSTQRSFERFPLERDLKPTK